MKKEQYLRLALTLTASLAAYKFRKYKWIAGALVPIVATGLEAVLNPKLAHAPATEPNGRRLRDSSYL